MNATATESPATIRISVTRQINGCEVVFDAKADSKEEAMQTASYLADAKLAEIAAAAKETTTAATTAVGKASAKPSPEKTPEASQDAGKPEAGGGAADAGVEEGTDTTTKEYYKTVVGPAVTSLVTAKGKPAAIALLAEFGVTKADQLDPSRFGDLVARANELRAA